MISIVCPAEDNQTLQEEIKKLSSRYPLQELKEDASFLKALADPVRLKILKLLSHREMCVCELNVALDITQPTLSYHLKILEKEGLVKSRSRGKWKLYSIASERVGKVIKEVERILMDWRSLTPRR